MSEQEQRTPRKRAIRLITRAKTPTRGGARAANAAIAAALAAPPVAPPAGIPPGNVVADRPIHQLVEQFLKLNPPKFTGTGDLETASRWVRDLGKAFALLRIMPVSGGQAVQENVFPEGVIPTWDAFLRAFNEQYFSKNAREQKMDEFQRLRQGSMTVDQYEVKFAELSQYAPRLIEDPEEKARRFKNGLRLELKQPLVPFDLHDYREIYRRAQLIERDLNEQAAASGSRFNAHRNSIRFGKKPMVGRRYPIPPNRKGGVGKSAPSNNGACRFCGKQHGSAPCYTRT
ncbi:uncharacterized protein LOC120295982 [Eucalyptus grandis]|uniref:uncharacterized protein LOC120295982 n=1 Tax=Eucalyptus grandis TaxID=71139 RepID=UPI00192E7632|nr:uncharacterized protein LOC120295982 [Eucalyptus grandis]